MMRLSRKNLADTLETLISIEDRKVMHGRWHELFDQAPPKNISLDLMRKAIAYQMQEKVHYGLKPTTRRYLQDLVKRSAKDSTASTAKLKPLEPGAQPGTRLVREWHGRVHEVLVEANGVLMNGQKYKSLSEAAKAITGAHWSGPRFFGLKKVKSQ